MFRAKKNAARQNGTRNRTQTRLYLEPLEDRWMPTVAAPVWTATAVSPSEIDLQWNSVSGANGYLVDEWINGAWQQIGSLTRQSRDVTARSRQTGNKAGLNRVSRRCEHDRNGCCLSPQRPRDIDLERTNSAAISAKRSSLPRPSDTQS